MFSYAEVKFGKAIHLLFLLITLSLIASLLLDEPFFENILRPLGPFLLLIAVLTKFNPLQGGVGLYLALLLLISGTGEILFNFQSSHNLQITAFALFAVSRIFYFTLLRVNSAYFITVTFDKLLLILAPPLLVFSFFSFVILPKVPSSDFFIVVFYSILNVLLVCTIALNNSRGKFRWYLQISVYSVILSDIIGAYQIYYNKSTDNFFLVTILTSISYFTITDAFLSNAHKEKDS